MRKLTSQGERAVADLSARYGVSTGAVRAMLEAVRLGNGTMAQFSHPEFGGRGQWMAGGMTMVGDMFNHGLQATVSGLASELSSLLASTPVYAPAPGPVTAAGPGPVHQANLGSWWPGELGRPGSSGSQDNSRYAVFPQARRLAVQSGGGPVRVYDTLGHAHRRRAAAAGRAAGQAVVHQPVRHVHRREPAAGEPCPGNAARSRARRGPRSCCAARARAASGPPGGPPHLRRPPRRLSGHPRPEPTPMRCWRPSNGSAICTSAAS